MRPSPYPRYKPGPAEWLGDLPDHWKVERVKYSLTEKRSRTAPDLPAGAISYGRVVAKDGEGLPEETRATYQEVLAGEYLINPINLNYDLVSLRTALSSIDVVVSPAYIVAKPDAAKLLPAFGSYLLYVFDIHHMKTLGAGIRQTIGFKDIGNCYWALPPMDEQEVIGAFLDRETGRIDTLIEKKRRFIELLNEKEKGEISRLVRRGLDQSAALIDSGIAWRGSVPHQWVRARLKDHFRLQKRLGYEHLPVLSVYREFGVIEKSSRNDNINKTPEDLSKYQLVKRHDLVVNKMKAWQGSMGVAPMDGITSPDYVVMSPVADHDPRYMHHYLRAQPLPWVYRLISDGIREDQWRMDPNKFLGLPIFLPSLEEQCAIADGIDCELERIRCLIAKSELSIDLLTEKRSALITAAVTGKIDVCGTKNMKAAA